MKEIVAEKVKGIQWVYLALAVVCAGLLVYFSGFYSANTFIKFIISAILLVFTVICFVSFIFALRTPKTIVAYDDSGTLTFPEFLCRPRDLEGVECKFSKNRGNGTTAGYGTLYITYKDKQYTYHYVSDLEKASSRLIELIKADKALQQLEEEDRKNG